MEPNMQTRESCNAICSCRQPKHQPKRVVITGGPGAGKTALLELAKRRFCEHVLVLPEAASILFSGGFWRRDTLACKKGIQSAIFHVQSELENIAMEDSGAALILCDRGTLDGLAYWPGDAASYWERTGSNKAQELLKYAAVIHLRTPPAHQGYERSSIRTETSAEAARIDHLIELAWSGHPKRFFIDGHENFPDKALKGLNLIENEVPDCCRSH